MQALTAIGSGGLFGVGLGESVQKIFYLPEAHTDMILAIIGEELGLIGILAVIVLYGMIGYAGLRAAKLARDRYAKLLAAGITSLILCQATLNFFAVLGMAPLTGVPLPFISYGSTNLIVLLRRDGAAAERGGHGRRGRAARPQAGPAGDRRRRRGALPAPGAGGPRRALSPLRSGGCRRSRSPPAGRPATSCRRSRSRTRCATAGVEVEFIGGERAEAELVPAAGYPFHALA